MFWESAYLAANNDEVVAQCADDLELGLEVLSRWYCDVESHLDAGVVEEFDEDLECYIKLNILALIQIIQSKILPVISW